MIKYKKIMQPVGFEPTSLATVAFTGTTLDRSVIAAFAINDSILLSFKYNKKKEE
jgi:hypothetical protein